MVTEEQIANLKKSLEAKPTLAEMFNVLWWREVHERIGEIAEDDTREQAENAFGILASLLSDDDQIENLEEIE